MLSTELKSKLAILKSLKADVSSVIPSSERLEELWVMRGFTFPINSVDPFSAYKPTSNSQHLQSF